MTSVDDTVRDTDHSTGGRSIVMQELAPMGQPRIHDPRDPSGSSAHIDLSSSALSESDAPLGEVIRRDLAGDSIAHKDLRSARMKRRQSWAAPMQRRETRAMRGREALADARQGRANEAGPGDAGWGYIAP